MNIHILQHQFQTNFTIIRLILLKISAYWKKHNHRHAKKAMIWKCSNVKHNFIQHIKCFISTFKSSGGFHIKIIYSYWKKCHTNMDCSIKQHTCSVFNMTLICIRENASLCFSLIQINHILLNPIPCFSALYNYK